MNKFLPIVLLLVLTPVLSDNRAMLYDSVKQHRINSVTVQVMNQSQLRSEVSAAVMSVNTTQLRINQTDVLINSREAIINASRMVKHLRISVEEVAVNGLKLFNESPVRTTIKAMVSTRSGNRTVEFVRENNYVKLVDNGLVVNLSLNQRVRLEDGRLILNQSGIEKELSVLPSQAMNQLRITNETIKSIKLSVEGNKTVYKIQEERTARLFGFIPVKLSVESSVDAVNGEIVNERKPWWSFLTI